MEPLSKINQISIKLLLTIIRMRTIKNIRILIQIYLLIESTLFYLGISPIFAH